MKEQIENQASFYNDRFMFGEEGEMNTEKKEVVFIDISNEYEVLVSRTENILKKIAEKDERVSVFHQENKGGGAARNYALTKATGKYIYFMDLDDLLKENPNLKITMVDERMTTIIANNRLMEANLSRAKRKAVIDKMSAVVILESYMSMGGR